jgi:hypothetical protein
MAMPPAPPEESSGLLVVRKTRWLLCLPIDHLANLWPIVPAIAKPRQDWNIKEKLDSWAASLCFR